MSTSRFIGKGAFCDLLFVVLLHASSLQEQLQESILVKRCPGIKIQSKVFLAKTFGHLLGSLLHEGLSIVVSRGTPRLLNRGLGLPLTGRLWPFHSVCDCDLRGYVFYDVRRFRHEIPSCCLSLLYSF